MIKNWKLRRLTAVIGFFIIAMGSTPAAAQGAAALKIDSVVRSIVAVDFDLAAPRGATPAPQIDRATVPMASTAAPTGVVNAIRTGVATAIHAVTHAFGPGSIAADAKWLHDGGWPLHALVDKFATTTELDEQMTCLATAVYFEARGESAEGQLAVARVVMNRAASGKYPPSWCATVKQPWQFSFVRNGRFPRVDTSSATWARAQAVAELAVANVVPSLSNDVLWYHADYVAPAWGPRLVRVEKIGAHIFYRA
ncbi:MAG: cell wall hydrolase [Sphingomicrobium sp.]